VGSEIDSEYETRVRSSPAATESRMARTPSAAVDGSEMGVLQAGEGAVVSMRQELEFG
jgi:hypothetical protein